MHKSEEDRAWESLANWMKAFGRKNFLLKYNQNHDERGRFSTSDGAGGNAKNPIYQKKKRFVDKYLTATKKTAKQLNVPVEYLLGLAAVESGWGVASRFAVQGNSFFSMHYPA